MKSVDRARALVGVPFRWQGRDAETGLDCLGLLSTVYCLRVPADYGWRGHGEALAASLFRAAGWRPVETMIAGDVLLLDAGRGRLHFAIWTGGSHIHADAVSRRVVERRGLPAAEFINIFRPES